MAKWSKGREVYEQLVSAIAESAALPDSIEPMALSVVQKAKNLVPEYVSALRVQELVSVHEYLMRMSEIRTDLSFPVYEYHGGDRVISVTRYLLKHISLELAKSYV